MMTRSLWISMMGAVIAFGCAEVRSSSRDHLSDLESQILLPMAFTESKKAITDAFARRGFPIAGERTVRNNITMCTYAGSRGFRTAKMSSNGDSVFYALYQPRGMQTHVTLFGKPSVNGRVTCSDYDQLLGIPCGEAVTSVLWFGRGRTTGREEAETIRGIELELAGAIVGIEHPSTPGILAGRDSAKNPMDENCNLEGTREWKNADALGRKLMLDECRRSR